MKNKRSTTLLPFFNDPNQTHDKEKNERRVEKNDGKKKEEERIDVGLRLCAV